MVSRSAVAAFLVLLLAACDPPDQPSTFSEQAPASQAPAGEPMPGAGPASDFNKSCRSRSDCEHFCRSRDPSAEIGEEVDGYCTSDGFSQGCFNLVHEGKQAGEICAM